MRVLLFLFKAKGSKEKRTPKKISVQKKYIKL